MRESKFENGEGTADVTAQGLALVKATEYDKASKLEMKASCSMKLFVTKMP